MIIDKTLIIYFGQSLNFVWRVTSDKLCVNVATLFLSLNCCNITRLLALAFIKSCLLALLANFSYWIYEQICVDMKNVSKTKTVVGYSHFDTDTNGQIMFRVLGHKLMTRITFLCALWTIVILIMAHSKGNCVTSTQTHVHT